MPYVMKILGTQTAAQLIDEFVNDQLPRPEYLVAFDPDAYAGRGSIRTSFKLSEAKRFADFIELMEEWKRPSVVLPRRPDGKPNRPLTAFSIHPMEVVE